MNLARPALLALVLCLGLSGCLIGSRSRTHHEGRYVSQETLAQIETGRSKAYVLALIGEPSEKKTVDEHTELWSWSYTERTDSGGHVIFILSSDRSTETQRTTFVEFHDSLVVKAWNG
jgi:outer membrane protein assembly factor BamE (lipoprotein component of BamABCDE complex)